MKKSLYFIAILVASAYQTQAQTNIQTMSSKSIFGAEASFLNPAFLKNTRGFQLNIGPLMAANVLIGNNFASAGNLIDLAKNHNNNNNEVNFAPVHEMIDNLKSV